MMSNWFPVLILVSIAVVVIALMILIENSDWFDRHERFKGCLMASIIVVGISSWFIFAGVEILSVLNYNPINCVLNCSIGSCVNECINQDVNNYTCKIYCYELNSKPDDCDKCFRLNGLSGI